MNSIISTQILIHKLGIPTEICTIIKNYVFHEIKKLPKTDNRYAILLTIPIPLKLTNSHMSSVSLQISFNAKITLTYSYNFIYIRKYHLIEDTYINTHAILMDRDFILIVS
jgi:hypothetical protein